MLSERLAVVRRDGDDRSRVLGVPRRQQLAQGRIDGGDLVAIRVVGPKRRGRVIGMMRIEVVHPDEGRLAMRLDPRLGGRRHVAGSSFRELEMNAGAALEAIVVAVEAAAEAEAMVQRQGADDRRGGEAASLEDLRQGRGPAPSANEPLPRTPCAGG